MRAMALLMITTILVVPLAGCVDSGDGPQFELSPEDIEQLIDDNMEDFLNNTSITLNQNVNYYNNSSVQQPSVLKSSSGSMSGSEYSSAGGGGTAILVRYDVNNDGSVGLGMESLKVCVGTGTITEQNLVNWFNNIDINIDIVPVADDAEATTKLVDGSCDAIAFDTLAKAEQKYEALNGSMETDLWIDTRYSVSDTSPGEVGNSISVIITQSSNEMLTGIEYLYTQVTLTATCINSNDSGCEDIVQMLSYDVESTTMETICSHNVSFSWSFSTQIFSPQLPVFRGHGLDCTHTINLHAVNQIEGVDGYGSTSHELSWSDWAYSIIWESVPIEN